MLPNALLSQAIEQARAASLELRTLLVQTDPPTVEQVKSCFEKGAQADWMGTNGNFGSDHALAQVCRKGWAQLIPVIAHHMDPSSLTVSPFVAALGKYARQADLESFRQVIRALKGVGYDLASEAFHKKPALEVAFSQGQAAQAAILMEEGALPANAPLSLVLEIARKSLNIVGGPEAFLGNLPACVAQKFAQEWWKLVENDRRSQHAPILAEKAIELFGFPNLESATAIAHDSPELFLALCQQGMEHPAWGQENDWEENPPVPFWKIHRHSVEQMLGLNGPLPPCLALSEQDPSTGYTWLMAEVVENHLVHPHFDFRGSADEKMAHKIRRAIEGGMDPHARDIHGKTAGWYIVDELSRLPEMERMNYPKAIEQSKAWMEIVRDCKLWAAPVEIDGQLVSLWEASPALKKMGSWMGMGPLIQADIQSWSLACTTQEVVSPPRPRRM